MSGHPDAAALVAAVEAFVRGLEGELAGRTAFHAKVAANALAIVARELRQEPAAAEAAALGRLLGRAGGADELRSAICAGLRDGSLGIDTAGLVQALTEAAVARLAVDNPRYSTLARLRDGAALSPAPPPR